MSILLIDLVVDTDRCVNKYVRMFRVWHGGGHKLRGYLFEYKVVLPGMFYLEAHKIKSRKRPEHRSGSTQATVYDAVLFSFEFFVLQVSCR